MVESQSKEGVAKKEGRLGRDCAKLCGSVRPEQEFGFESKCNGGSPSTGKGLSKGLM